LVSILLPSYWGFLDPDGNPVAALYEGNLYLLSSSGTANQATLYRVPVQERP
jgi:hypothetical protein